MCFASSLELHIDVILSFELLEDDCDDNRPNKAEVTCWLLWVLQLIPSDTPNTELPLALFAREVLAFVFAMDGPDEEDWSAINRSES